LSDNAFADHRGRLLFDVELADVWNGVGPCLALHRAELHQVLLAGVRDVPIRWGHGLRALTVDDEGVTVKFSCATRRGSQHGHQS